MKALGWELDYKKFRVWLTDKFSITRAYIFLGNIPKYSNLYAHLQECGYTLIFKEVVYDGEGKAKGNCDADLVLKTVQEHYENGYDNAVIVSSDGDYASLIIFLMSKNKLKAILSPANEKKCSVLLKRTGAKISYINNQRSNIELA
ncbi:NYN domain-containing protein [Candidatus Nomurabacteria bacterium]|nr:NYN domain-containing protein [Candidatus Nomurabacteria bacterium]